MKLLLLRSRFPECHEVIVLSVVIFSHLKNEREKVLSCSANGSVLLWHIRALVKVVGMLKDLLRLLKADPAFGVRP
jgi:hypothetical protein